jgi:hypothetical protein
MFAYLQKHPKVNTVLNRRHDNQPSATSARLSVFNPKRLPLHGSAGMLQPEVDALDPNPEVWNPNNPKPPSCRSKEAMKELQGLSRVLGTLVCVYSGGCHAKTSPAPPEL